jgi:DNA polymerase-3 subunit delta
MQPAGLFTALDRGRVAPAYLFLGPDYYSRREAREAIFEKVLGRENHDNGVIRLDLEETTLAAVLDDAASLSLFASERVLWVANAEAALPKRISSKDDEDGPGAALAAYLRNPTPGTVILFDCLRYGLEGDDKAKLDRVRKFYAAIPAVVEFAPLSPSDAAALTREVAKAEGVQLTASQAATLAEALGADTGRIHLEVAKLGLYAPGRLLTDAELADLIPNARAANIFGLVNALARSDRAAALQILDILVREGEYLPLVLTFLATQFRLAAAAVEANAKSSSQIQQHFSRLGVAMWKSRADQLADTLRVFPPQKLKRAIELTFEADRALRDARPDDRTVMESFVWKLTAA